MQTLFPLNDQVLLEKIEEENKTEGLVIPDSVDKRYLYAKVLKVAWFPGGAPLSAPSVGQTVVVPKSLGMTVKLENKVYILVDYRQILAFVGSEVSD